MDVLAGKQQIACRITPSACLAAACAYDSAGHGWVQQRPGDSYFSRRTAVALANRAKLLYQREVLRKLGS